jgi:hypothetical protein
MTVIEGFKKSLIFLLIKKLTPEWFGAAAHRDQHNHKFPDALKLQQSFH